MHSTRLILQAVYINTAYTPMFNAVGCSAFPDHLSATTHASYHDACICSSMLLSIVIDVRVTCSLRLHEVEVIKRLNKTSTL